MQEVRDRNVTEYDTDFVVSEVSSAVYKYAVPASLTLIPVSYIGYPTGGARHPRLPGMFLLSVDANLIGRTMGTSSVLNHTFEDITADYKHSPVTTSSQVTQRDLVARLDSPDAIASGDPLHLRASVACQRCNSSHPLCAIPTLLICANMTGTLP